MSKESYNDQTISLQTLHVDSTLKRHGNGNDVIPRWNDVECFYDMS